MASCSGGSTWFMNVDLAQCLSSPCGDWADCCQRELAQMAFLHSAACCWEQCCRCVVWHCGSAVHSGAVCDTVRCDVCPVVPFVTLGLVMFAQWCRLLHCEMWCVCPVVRFVTLGLTINPSLLWRHSYKLLHWSICMFPCKEGIDLLIAPWRLTDLSSWCWWLLIRCGARRLVGLE